MVTQVDPPVRVPYRYGLLSTAQIVEHGPNFRLNADYQFDSVACNTGLIWDPACAPEFTVTFTRTALADEFTVTATPGVLADYEYNVNGGAFTPLTSPITITEAPPVTVTVREVGGLQRSVTRTDIDPDSPQGTQFVFQSEQTDNPPKTLTEGIGNQTASPFVVVSGVSCTLIATPDIEQKARDAFTSVEQRLVEQNFWNTQLANSNPDLPVGATAQTVVAGVAVLEEYVRANTGAVGVLHSGSYLGAFASANDLIPETNPEMVKRTGLWTPWAFGGGYARTGPTGQPAPGPTELWMYVTGPIVAHRGDIFVPADRRQAFDVATNQAFIVVERSYVVIPDCPVAAVLIDTAL